MSSAAFDPKLLLTPEVQALLRKHGLAAQVSFTPVQGEAVADATLEQLHEDLLEAEQRINHLHQLATVGEVSAGVLHEARNLLTGVVGLSLIRTSDETHLELLRNEANRCSKLLTTFLNTASRAPSYPTPVQPFEMLGSVVMLLGAEAKTRRCTLSSDATDDVPALLTYGHELQQVVLNLTLNAIEASPEGGHVVLSASYTDTELAIHVSDQGSGIASEMLERIFEPFVSSKPPSRGTGLGLSTSRRLVESMRGRLTVENRGDGGARFTVTLPRTTPPFAALKAGGGE
jgi:signal transduction histidine kinase